MRREADTRPQERWLATALGGAGIPAHAFAALARVRDRLSRLPRPADLAEFRSLGLAWFTMVGLGVAAAGVLQALGPPAPTRLADPARASTMAARAQPDAVKAPPGIPTLLARVESQITDTPDGPSPDADAARTLRQVADALPHASPADRDLANTMAANLYERAKAALDGGRIDEEQRWLALGAVLAPPPDLAPGGAQLAQQAAPQASDQPSSEPRQDVTPNEAEAEANSPSDSGAAHSSPPAPSSGTVPARPDPQTGQATVAATESAPQPATPPDGTEADLPRLRPPDARPPNLAPAPDTAEPPASPASPSTTETTSAEDRVAIHFQAGSDFAETQAKALAERLAGTFGPSATQSAADVPAAAVIRYTRSDDHARAREIGEVLGRMGYPWHLQRSNSAEAASGASGLDVWLPTGDPVRIARPHYVAAYGRPRVWWSALIPPWF